MNILLVWAAALMVADHHGFTIGFAVFVALDLLDDIRIAAKRK